MPFSPYAICSIQGEGNYVPPGLHEQIRLNVEVCFVSNTLMDKNVHRKIRVKGTYITLDRRGLDRLLFHHSAETN